MPTAEPKRRGRPPKAKETFDAAPEPVVEREPEPERDPAPEPETPPADPNAPRCERCGDAMETSRVLLRAYGMTCHRCLRCREVAIEGDTPFDFLTALSGNPPLLVERAAALHAAKRLAGSPIPDDPSSAAMHSAWDERWTTAGD